MINAILTCFPFNTCLKDSYILDMDKLKIAKEDLSILHPLPRVNEISVKVDNDPRACYFKQVLNGKHVRMALIMELLGVSADEILMISFFPILLLFTFLMIATLQSN